MSDKIAQRDLKRWIKKAHRVIKHTAIKHALERASKPLRVQAKSNAKRAARVIRRHTGNGVIEYHQGNLKRSIMRIRSLGRSRAKNMAIYVGAKYAKRQPKVKGGKSNKSVIKRYKGRTVDGFYAHMLNSGTKHIRADKFWDRAVSSTESAVIKQATKEIIRKIREESNKLGIK